MNASPRTLRGACALVTMLCLLGGCASSRWLDERTAGDLWNTRGAELPAVKMLGRAPPERRSASERDEPAERARGAGVREDTALEILIGVFAAW